MKRIYKHIDVASSEILLTLALFSDVGGTESVGAAELDMLKAQLSRPNYTGAEQLKVANVQRSHLEITDNGEVLAVLHRLKRGENRFVCKARYGTNISVQIMIDFVVSNPNETTPVEISENVVLVENIGDGGGDASVYTKDADGNAHITKPLNVSGSVQEGNPYGEVIGLDVVVLTPEQKEEVQGETGTAYDYCDVNDAIEDGMNVTIYADEECTQKVGSTAESEYAEVPMSGDFFNLQEGESISAGTYYARRERGTLGDNSHAEGKSTTASGDNSHAEGNSTAANGANSHAEGNSTAANGANSHAEGNSTAANGSYSHAEGSSTIAIGSGSHAEGVSTTASGSHSHAEGSGTTASGSQSHAEGNGTTASGDNSHAEGNGTISTQNSQHVCGEFNVEDTGNLFLFIVGNGTDYATRHNAFAVTKSGGLALFKADGTPVILDVATLEALIASL